MTVLILAAERDNTADRMVRALEHRSVPAVRVDTALFPQRAHLDAELRGGQWTGTLHTSRRRIVLEKLRSIWYRSPSAFRFHTGMSATERHWAMNEAKYGLGGILASLPVLWVNHPNRNAAAAYKPVQLVTAAHCGLTVPETLIANQAGAVRTFAGHGPTVTKALGAAAIVEENGRKTTFTAPVGWLEDDDLRGIERTAHQFQRWVPKDFEARVIVVGDHVFAAAIHASTPESRIDWRNDYRALRYAPIRPPDDVQAGVHRYCAELGLVYGAFDFIIRPDEGWVFLECNAGGQYGWIEDAIDAPITTTIAALLAKGADG